MSWCDGCILQPGKKSPIVSAANQEPLTHGAMRFSMVKVPGKDYHVRL